jgi:predicted nucleic acid-binding protein
LRNTVSEVLRRVEGGPRVTVTVDLGSPASRHRGSAHVRWLVAELRTRQRRFPIVDALVAAAAIVEQVPVVTRARNYDVIPGVEVIRV